MGRSALVVGATGLTGKQVVSLLLERPEWDRVVVLVRRPSGTTHAKLTEHIVDFDALTDAPFEGVTDVFACLGTTMKKAGSEEAFRKIDHEYTVDVATRAHRAGARRLGLVSSVGASTNASAFYFRVKGETERDVRALGWSTLVIVRPSMLRGEREEHRTGEKFGIVASSALAFAMVGPLKKYRPIDASAVTKKLVDLVEAKVEGEQVLEYEALVGT